MIKRIFFIALVFAFFGFKNIANAQNSYSIRAKVPKFSNSEILLKGYTFQGDTLLSFAKANNEGEFVLHYPSSYVGLASIVYGENNKKALVLNHEDIDFTNEGHYNEFYFVNSMENKLVNKGNNLLESSDFMLIKSSIQYAEHAQEPTKRDFYLNMIKEKEDSIDIVIASFPPSSYAKFFINFRKSMLSMNITANKIPSRLQAHETVFNHFNFNDERLRSSSCYKNFIEIYFRLLSTYGSDERVKHINNSIDAIVLGLKENPKLLEYISVYLLDVLEQNRYESSVNYLASSMLLESNRLLTSKSKKRFEACLVKKTD